jgi:hypothetical protein
MQTRLHTMIFAIPSNAQAPSFDCGKTEPNGFSQSCSVNMRNSVLVADPSIREIEPLPRDIPVGIGCIVGGEPVENFRITLSLRQVTRLTMLAQKSVWPYQTH